MINRERLDSFVSRKMKRINSQDVECMLRTTLTNADTSLSRRVVLWIISQWNISARIIVVKSSLKMLKVFMLEMNE